MDARRLARPVAFCRASSSTRRRYRLVARGAWLCTAHFDMAIARRAFTPLNGHCRVSLIACSCRRKSRLRPRTCRRNHDRKAHNVLLGIREEPGHLPKQRLLRFHDGVCHHQRWLDRGPDPFAPKRILTSHSTAPSCVVSLSQRAAAGLITTDPEPSEFDTIVNHPSPLRRNTRLTRPAAFLSAPP